MRPAILIVEDSATQVARLRELLEGEGYRVAVAAHGREGLQQVESARPDLVISDVLLPEVDGFSFCRALKGNESTRHIPLVLLTTEDSPLDVFIAFERGADTVISKPVDPGHLLATVRRLVSDPTGPRAHPAAEFSLRLGDRELSVPWGQRRLIELVAGLAQTSAGARTVEAETSAGGPVAPDTWTDRVRAALDGGRFVGFFQPVVTVENGHVWQYEVLARMTAEGGAIVAPAEFLPPAEGSTLVNRIDLLMWQRAIHLLGTHRQGDRILRLAVNISARTLLTPSVVERMADMLFLQRLDPALLTVEITELAVMDDLDRAAQAIRELKRCGCRFALDHFGVAHATIEHLRDLPVDSLKIDGRFVQNLPNSETDRRLVKAMTHMAHDLGLVVVAEFVGDATTFELVREFGVDFAQGYYLGRPMPELPPAVTAEKADARLQTLTERELEVLRCIAQGLDNEEIAKTLSISAKTVKVHVSRVLAKLDVTDRTKAAIVALRAHLVEG